MPANLYMGVDADGWCFDRVFSSLRKHSGFENWRRIKAGDSFESLTPGPFRIGGFSLFVHFAKNMRMYVWRNLCMPTCSSFQSLEKGEVLDDIKEHLFFVGAIGYVDRRMVPDLLCFNKPLVYCPTCVDPTVFFPQPALRPKDLTKPLRVGWAGSEIYWKNLKHGKEIKEACEKTGVEFVRQDREKDGQKSAEEMCKWLNSLDVYVSANEINTCTPVPQIEAIACGVLPITTRCGERWRFIQGLDENLIIGLPRVEAIVKVIEYCKDNRKRLHEMGMELRKRHLFTEISWTAGEAVLQTKAMLKLLEK